jgi:hypothetical protein
MVDVSTPTAYREPTPFSFLVAAYGRAAALRWIQQPAVRGWYEGKKQRDQNRALGAVVAVMRKLALALHAVGGREAPFDPWRLLPGAAGRAGGALGALPPNPRDLAPGSQSRKVRKGGGRVSDSTAPTLGLGPGAALGSVPTGALSSAQAEQA